MSKYTITDDGGLHVAPNSDLEYREDPAKEETSQTTVQQWSDAVYTPASEHPPEEVYPRDRGCWGSRGTSTTLAMLLAIVILVAAIGGGVGGAKAVQNARKSALESCASANSTNTTASDVNFANYTLPAPSQIQTAFQDCSRTSYTASAGQSFITDCGVDHPSGKPASTGNGTVGDLIGLMAYSLDACIENCAQWNYYFGPGACAVVVWNDGVAYWWGAYQSNCWLKNATSANPAVNVGGQVSAVLVTVDHASGGGNGTAGNGTSGGNGTASGTNSRSPKSVASTASASSSSSAIATGPSSAAASTASVVSSLLPATGTATSSVDASTASPISSLLSATSASASATSTS